MIGICDPVRGELEMEQAALIEKLWILGADHELTNSTSVLLHAASSFSEPVSYVVGAIASGYGPCISVLRKVHID